MSNGGGKNNVCLNGACVTSDVSSFSLLSTVF